MRYATQVKPISHLKAKAAEVLRDLSELREPLVITQAVERIRARGAERDLAELHRYVHLGIREYRQLLVGPYRLICRGIDTRVYTSVIADGRRDKQSLLEPGCSGSRHGRRDRAPEVGTDRHSSPDGGDP